MTTWEDVAKTFVVLLIGSGGATFIWTLFKSFIAWRDSAEGREDKAVGRLEKFEANCRKDLAWERAMGEHWRSWAGTLEYTLHIHGIPLPPRPTSPQRSQTDLEA